MNQGSLESGVAGNYQFDVSDALKEAWQKTDGAKLTILLAALAYFGVVLAASFVVGMIFGLVGLGGNPQSFGGVVGSILQQLVLMAITLPLIAGMLMLGIKRATGQPIAVGEIFGYYDRTVNLVITMVIMYVMLIIGFLLLILPGIYLAVAYYLALPLVVEKKLAPWEALEASRKAITKRWFAVFIFLLVVGAIIIVSAIPLGIGLIWTVPMASIAYGILYRNVFGVQGAAPGNPA